VSLHPRQGPVIGALSTSFGGAYFGEMVTGLAAATAEARGSLICIQTFEAGTYHRDLPAAPAFRPRLGWDHIDAFAVVLNSVDEEYLRLLRQAGKPMVMVSDSSPGFRCPVVLPDNRGGINQAVDHLVAHGHRRIAFAGFPLVRDIVERYQAYQDALRRHGITPDPALFYDTGNNQLSGGTVAATAMIAAGLPSTAVITGNDANAVGLMRTLQKAGYELPRDQAVIGFDDLETSVYLVPGMASVRQPIELIGRRAVELLRSALAGDDVPDDASYVPTRLVPRESCGCPSTLRLGGRRPAVAGPTAEARVGTAATAGSGSGSDVDVDVDIGSPEELAAAVRLALDLDDVHTSLDQSGIGRGVDAVVEVLHAAREHRPAPAVDRTRAALEALHQARPAAEGVVRVLRCVRRYCRGLVAAATARGDEATRTRLEEALQEIILDLSFTQVRAGRVDTARFEQAFASQHVVSMSLLRSSHEEDPRRLDWLQRTPARAASLALWDQDAGTGEERRLTIVGTFRALAADEPLAGGPTTIEAFPPREMVDLADLAGDEMVFVAPMRVNASDWGFLAVVGPIEARLITGREIMNQWAALLTIALDHGAVLESLRQQEELLRRAALYDELTGLPNRALFFDRLKYSIERARRRPDYRFGVFLLDLDGFKIVNDSLGHLAGDQLLVEVAGRIQSSLRVNDVAARLGGDEFAVLLDDLADDEGAAEIAERMRAVLGQPCVIDGQDIVVTASIGVALSSGRYEQPQDVIRDADIAMYSAKNREKGTHAVFDVSMGAQAHSRLRTEGELRRAIEHQELELHYQPIVALDSGRIAAFEALIRWRHPDRGLIPPGDFLPIAEECGLMLPIGRWVLEQACGQLGAWRADGLADDVRMSVNVSNRQFWHGHLVEDLTECLTAAGIAAQDIGIEITEGVIMHDVKLARSVLDALHDLGASLHIDDFGTGYSSLEALHHLPIDALKIDRSFVTGLGTDQRSEELARAIIAMGTSLGMELVAEGIETEDHRDRLRDLGCTYGQGYWIARPMPAAAAANALVLAVHPSP